MKIATLIISLFVALAFVGSAMAVGPGKTIEYAGGDQGKVVFSGDTHGAKQGMNDFRRIGYGGPMPPPGSPHRYYFKIYALDAKPDLKSGGTKDKLLAAAKGHLLAEGQLMGTYKRR